MSIVSMREMLEAGVHFGHKKRFWNPKMAPYIYGARHEIHIINLDETLPLFNRALKFMGDVAARRGRILFVGTKYAARDIIREEAARCGMPYVNYRWLGGMLTNYKTIRQSIKRLKVLEEQLSNVKALEGLTKKEMLQLMREKDKLASILDGIKDMGGLPDILFVIDVGAEKIAITEAKRLGIPVVGIVDTNSSPEGIDYPIPGNDDAQRSIRLYCSALANVILEKRAETEPLPVEATEAEADKKEVVVKKRRLVRKATEIMEEGGTEADVEEVEEIPPVEKPKAVKAKPAIKKAAAKKTEKPVKTEKKAAKKSS